MELVQKLKHGTGKKAPSISLMPAINWDCIFLLIPLDLIRFSLISVHVRKETGVVWRIVCAITVCTLYFFRLVHIPNYFFELDNGSGYAQRGHKWKLKVNRCRLQLRQCFFSQRVVNTWNRLPAFVVDASSVNSFKKRVDDWTLDVDI